MELISFNTILPYLSLPLITVIRQLMVSRTYGCLAYLNKQSSKNKIAYSDELPPLSIIITTHNQAVQLEHNLPLILEQDYPKFEVIVVNESSMDSTEEVLKEMSFRYKHLYHTFTLPSARYISKKKLAITLGLKASHNDWIVLTEADCVPSSNQWLRLMARNFVDDTRIVLGYSNYISENNLFNRRIAIDRLIENCQFLSRVIYNDNGYRGEGCNLAFRKSLFIEQDGFAKNLHLARGEDSLLVNEMARKAQTRVECHPGAIMHQEPPISKKAWITDKVFYLETCKHFNSTGHWALRFFSMQKVVTSVTYLLILLYILIGSTSNNIILLILGILCLIVSIAGSIIPLYKTCKSIKERTFFLTLLWYELTYPLQSLALNLRHHLTRKDDFLRK